MSAAIPSKRSGVPLLGGLWSTLRVGVVLIGWPLVHPGGSLQRRSRLSRSHDRNIILPSAQVGSESSVRRLRMTQSGHRAGKSLDLDFCPVGPNGCRAS